MCKHCYTSSGTGGGKLELNTSEVKQVIDYLANLKIFAIIVTGGEPFIRRDFLQILEYCIDSNIFPSITSNGLLITKKVADNLKKLEIPSVQISVLGVRHFHEFVTSTENSYNKAITGIQNLVANDIDVVISTPLFSQIIPDQLQSMAQEFDRLGISTWKFMQFLPVGRGTNISTWRPSLDKLRLFYRLIKKIESEYDFNTIYYFPPGLPVVPNIKKYAGHPSLKYAGCSCGERSVVLTADGSIYPCAFLRTPDFYCGNILDDDFSKIWTSAPPLNLVRNARENIIGKCNQCQYFSVCGGGCRSFSYIMTGSLTTSDPTCFYSPSDSCDIYSFYLGDVDG